jgi:class 3 adenylate cyclase
MELESWLRSLGLEEYLAAFRNNAIDESVLVRLTAEDLKELGVKTVGHRRILLDAIARLRWSTGPRAEPLTAPATANESVAGVPPIDKAERRQVTVLLADLVGSTALSARMDPEDLREIISAYHKCAAQVVRRFGGFVSQYLGDGVLAYFGHPLAHEDDAERAVRTGLELIASVSALKTRVPLQTRVGIATGLVVVGDVLDAGGLQARGIIGETPNLAARLQDAARPNMVVIAEVTRKLLGDLFELEYLGTKELKGITDPVQVWAALRATSGASRFEALHASRLNAFVGREHELEVLQRAFDNAGSELRVVDLVAEPGMGKSRLIHEFRQRLGKDRAFILSGNCSSDGQQTAFLPFIEVVRRSFRINARETEKEIAEKLDMGLTTVGLHSRRNLGLLLHLLGLQAPNGALAGLDGALIGLRTRELLQQLLEALCRLSPVILVIEDLHWIDSVSEELLYKLVSGEGKLPLLLLHTRRPEYVPPWLDRAVVTKLRLEPLPAGEIRRLVQSRLGVEVLPETLVRQVTEKAEGNPLFAEEIVSFLTERGALRSTTDMAEYDPKVMAAALPASLQSLLTARVDRLAPKDRALLQAASVIGRRFDRDLLAAVVDKTVDIDARLVAMQTLDLVRTQDRSRDYFFKHALVRDALYQSLLTEARTALHARIAEEIERRSGNRLIEVAESLAHHYSQTKRIQKAFTYRAMAGSRSLSVYSLEEAETHFAAAIALVEADEGCAGDQQVADVLVDYTLLENALGKVVKVIQIVDRFGERLKNLGDNVQIVLVLHQKVFALCFNGQFQAALAQQAIITQMAERLGDDRSLAYSLSGWILVSSAVAPSKPEDQKLLVRSALKAASGTDDAYIRSVVRWVIAIDEINRGRMIEARTIAKEMSAIGDDLNDPRPKGMGMGILGWIALTSDDYGKARNYAEECLQFASTPQERMNALGVKGSALTFLAAQSPPADRRKKLEDADAVLSDIRKQLTDLNWGYEQIVLEPAYGVLTVLKGELGRGINIIQKAIASAHRDRWRAVEDWAKLFLCEVYLEVMFAKERPSLAILLRNLPAIIWIFFTGGSAIEKLISEVQRNSQFDPDGHHIGRAEMILGLLYKGTKRRSLAIHHLTQAQRILSQLGQTPIVTRVETALVELG